MEANRTVFEITCYARTNRAMPVAEGHYGSREGAIAEVERKIADSGKPADAWTRGELGNGYQWYAECASYGYTVTEVEADDPAEGE